MRVELGLRRGCVTVWREEESSAGRMVECAAWGGSILGE